MELKSVACAEKEGVETQPEGLSGDLNGRKEEPFRSGLEEAPGHRRAACAKAPRQGREPSWVVRI